MRREAVASVGVAVRWPAAGCPAKATRVRTSASVTSRLGSIQQGTAQELQNVLSRSGREGSQRASMPIWLRPRVEPFLASAKITQEGNAA